MSPDYVARVEEFTIYPAGKRLFHHEVVAGTAPDDFVSFSGVAQASIAPKPDRPGSDFEYRFPIPATTLSEAVAMFDESARSYGREVAIPRVQAKLEEEVKRLRGEGVQIARQMPQFPPPSK